MVTIPTYHTPALLEPTIDGLNINPSGTYVDVTFGGGGHSREILRRLGSGGRLFGFDQDIDALANVPDDSRFTFIHGNFRHITNFMRFHGVEHVDGILADLGVSFHHFDDPERGFSFRYDSALDMRMNRQARNTAATIVNSASEERLADILYNYGELPASRRLARAIVAARNEAEILTTGQLIDTVSPLINPRQQKKELAQIFQALRIEVNSEMDALRRLLSDSVSLLNNDGRLAIITYHSLEDRLVKNFMRAGNFEGKIEKDFFGRQMSPFKLINSKPIVASDDEVAANPRSRSAKLRIAYRINPLNK
ncbi:MAG: 16S rRNA (cytosine(1402)-N(4))-methyltransferase RsmH [Muribaculaceae bacterium]|nr:16S rRNA (cytosine(1402)-N(4))-methyltransferase RsmH [Muribaculaceae bacterium]